MRLVNKWENPSKLVVPADSKTPNMYFVLVVAAHNSNFFRYVLAKLLHISDLRMAEMAVLVVPVVTVVLLWDSRKNKAVVSMCIDCLLTGWNHQFVDGGTRYALQPWNCRQEMRLHFSKGDTIARGVGASFVH